MGIRILGVPVTVRFLLAPVVTSVLLGSSFVGAHPALAANSPDLASLTPTQLVYEFSDHQPTPIHLSGHGDGHFSTTIRLPNADALEVALANPNLTAQQRATLDSIPAEVTVYTTVTGTSGNDPIADAYMYANDPLGISLFKFEVNLGWNQSGGVVTGMSTPNYVGTTGYFGWSMSGSPTTTFPFSPLGENEFATQNFATFYSVLNVYDHAELDVSYTASNGNWSDYGYVNGNYVWSGSGSGQ